MKEPKHPCWLPLETHVSPEMYVRACDVAKARAAELGHDAQFHLEEFINEAVRQYRAPGT